LTLNDQDLRLAVSQEAYNSRLGFLIHGNREVRIVGRLAGGRNGISEHAEQPLEAAGVTTPSCALILSRRLICQGAFDNPSARQELKAGRAIGAFDDFDGSRGAEPHPPSSGSKHEGSHEIRRISA